MVIINNQHHPNTHTNTASHPYTYTPILHLILIPMFVLKASCVVTEEMYNVEGQIFFYNFHTNVYTFNAWKWERKIETLHATLR